jgi:DNA-binding SARP family transcriptional activator
MHVLKKDDEAADNLAQASDIATRTKNKLNQFLILWARSLFAFDEGKEAAGVSFLGEALAIGCEEGILETFIDHPQTMSMLCAKALEAGIEVEYVQELIRKRRLVPEKGHLYTDSWPWPLKVFTLGRFEVVKEGKPIQFPRKVQQRPLSLLKTLIAFGGKPAREDLVMDALWPQADGDMAQQSLATNLHRLRHLLGYEGAIQRQEGKLTVNRELCWVDAWAFEEILEQADGLLKQRNPDSAFRLIEKALGMYKGHFLATEIEQQRTISTGERLRDKFLRKADKLCLHHQESHQWEKALDCCLRGLEIDDLAEEFYSGLMISYQHMGRKADAVAVYERYRKTFSAILKSQPSARMDALYRTIVRFAG